MLLTLKQTTFELSVRYVDILEIFIRLSRVEMEVLNPLCNYFPGLVISSLNAYMSVYLGSSVDPHGAPLEVGSLLRWPLFVM